MPKYSKKTFIQFNHFTNVERSYYNLENGLYILFLKNTNYLDQYMDQMF